MPRARASDPAPQPSPAARVVYGAAFRVTQRPEGISSPATTELQAIAKRARSQQPTLWGVFPVHGQNTVVLGFLCARTPRAQEQSFAIEPGGELATEHQVVSYMAGQGLSVGTRNSERLDADCVEDFARSLADTDAWKALGATELPLRELPGGAHLDALDTASHLLLTDDGRGADVVYGMSFWRPGSTYREGRVDTWTRPAGDGTVRIVGLRLARVDADTPLTLAPVLAWDADAALRAEVRAVLDSDRPFATYFIADEPHG